ncbi:MAG: TonB C-terminal domain-containing protein [Desulfarculus sp.]|nr:MAG: TonB C-terminal domain-containing protein [Desulfarculus sp.]
MSVTALKTFHLPGSEQVGLAVALSLGLHLVMIAVLAFWPGWGPSRRQIFAPAYNVSLVSPQVFTRPAPAAPAAKPAAKPAPAARPRPAPKPAPKEAVGLKKEVKPQRVQPKAQEKQPDPSKELNQRLARLQSQVAQERNLDRTLSRLQQRVATRAAASGAFAAGPSQADTTSLRFQVYYTEIWERVRRHWVLPEALLGRQKGLEAIVVARINRNGSLDKVWLERGSGNRRLDQSALRAVERAAPFPALPSIVRGRSHEVGIRFRPEDING